MNTIGELAGRRVVVMGLGRFGGGAGVARWLSQQSADVVVTDLAGAPALKTSLAELADTGVEIHVGGHDLGLLDSAEMLIVNPAVPKERSEFFQEAVSRGIPWTTEINLFLSQCPARVVGVTGTAGKSTTSAMIDCILQRGLPSGRAFLGGNIGGSLLGHLVDMCPDDTVVLELSSFQLADLRQITRRPDIAVFLDVWPNHLDRHGAFDDYWSCKLNMIRDCAVDTAVVTNFQSAALMADVCRVAGQHGANIVRADEYGGRLALRLPGAHHAGNARCAAMACATLGVDDDSIRYGLEMFDGLPHRLRWVANVGGVAYYNDSKSTSPRTSAAAIRSFDRPVIALIGGRWRDTPLEPLTAALRERARTVICFGDAAFALRKIIVEISDTRPEMGLQSATTLEEAFHAARATATEGDVVLLSPGFDSYDAFANYERRGEAFESLVAAISS